LAATRDTLERIGRLAVDAVIPGHGAPFAEFDAAMELALARLASFETDGERLARHAVKVVFSFWLMEKRRFPAADVPEFLAGVSLYREINARYFHQAFDALAEWLIRDLVRAGAVRRDGGHLVAADGA
jgi:hypothetical protein